MIATYTDAESIPPYGNHLCRRPGALILLMLGSLLTISQLQGAELRDELLAMAQHTTDSVKSARVSYDETVTMRRGYLMSGVKGGRDAVPAADSNSTTRNRLVIAGRKFFLEDNSPVWGSRKGKSSLKEKNRIISANDGSITKQYYPDGIGPDSFASGIFLDETWVKVSELQYVPLIYSLCPLNGAITKYDVQKLTVDDSIAKWQGTDCIKAEQYAAPDKRFIFWFDRARRVLTHVEYLKNGKMRGQVNIDVDMSDLGWRPAKWTYLEQTDGQIDRTVSISNIKWDINVDVSDVDFGLDFPRNTRVYDRRTREEWVIDSSGKKHDLSDVLTTEAMARLTSQQRPGRPWLYIMMALGACAVMATISLVAFRKRRRSARKIS